MVRAIRFAETPTGMRSTRASGPLPPVDAIGWMLTTWNIFWLLKEEGRQPLSALRGPLYSNCPIWRIEQASLKFAQGNTAQFPSETTSITCQVAHLIKYLSLTDASP